jgi:hypothetical protein
VYLPQLRRVRWAVRATLVLGVAASVVANVLHAQENPISQAIAAWPPLALLLTVELISRVPVHRPSLAFARLFATATIAGIAAWVSYWHMAGVAAKYGETGASPYLLPLSVDGLIVVASICLVELGGRIASIDTGAIPAVAAHTTAAPTPAESPVTAVPAATVPAATVPAATVPAVGALAEVPAAGLPEFTPTVTRRAGPAAKPRTAPTPARAGSSPRRAAGASKAGATPRTAGTAERTAGSKRTAGSTPAAGATRAPAKPRRTAAETVSLAARIQADRPDATDAELAAELGISTSRLRTVRREAAQAGDLRLAA